MKARSQWLAAALLIASMPFAVMLVAQRVAVETRFERVAMVMDENALKRQAAFLGRTPLDLALAYREAGLTGIAVYEETLETLAASGAIVATTNAELRARALASGQTPPPLEGEATLFAELIPGAAAALLRKHDPAPQAIEYAGQTWWWWPGDSLSRRTAGPNLEQMQAWVDAGFDLAYRPRNYPNMQELDELHDGVRYIVHAGLEVAGYPNLADALPAWSHERLTAWIEGIPQVGLRELAREVPTVRLLSFDQAYQNQRLDPAVLADKYLLSVRERQVRLLYVRPYTEQQFGDMFENTVELIALMAAGLAREGLVLGTLEPPLPEHQPRGPLQWLAGAGVLAGAWLLLSTLPLGWGVWVGVMLAGLGLLAAGFSMGALALVAALTFPVLVYALLPWRAWTLVAALGVSLMGATLLAAVGSTPASMLALEPFAGVGATLVIPPLLFALIVMLRQRSAMQWVKLAWGYQPRLGEVAIALLALAALGLVFIRRGNFPIIGASEIELALRAALDDLFVRPRFKELIGYPLAFLALLQTRWPWWVRAALLLGGVVANASILNSFSHYHTPFIVSLQRTLIAWVLGAAGGLLLFVLVRPIEARLRQWLARTNA